jgi:hypothetical protein
MEVICSKIGELLMLVSFSSIPAECRQGVYSGTSTPSGVLLKGYLRNLFSLKNIEGADEQA